MRTKFVTLLCAAMAGMASVASAQENDHHPTVRLEAGMAAPLTQPQEHIYSAGVEGGGKLDFNLVPWLDVGPSITTTQLSSAGSGSGGYGVGGDWTFGAFARVKRSHYAPYSKFWGSASPWIDCDIQYVRTGDLNRMGVAPGIGVSGPMDENRQWWVGPFVRYEDVVDGTKLGGTVGKNTNDARMIVIGLSVEFDPVANKRAAPPPPPVVVNRPDDKTTVTVIPPPPPVKQEPTEVTVRLDQKIQFLWDSSELLRSDSSTGVPAAIPALVAAAKTINAYLVAHTDKDALQIQVDGHASSEGQVEHNNKLSVRRAQSVVDYLVAAGVPREVLSVKGFGSSKPVATNSTEAGRRQNRRVEFEVTLSFVNKGGK